MARISRVLSVVLFLFCELLAAAQTGPNQFTESLFANVLDRNGRAVQDLSKDNFRIKVNGRPAEIVEAKYSIAPRRIVVLLDISGSMAGDKYNQKWRIAREALEDLLADTTADVPIALLTFSDHVQDLFDFSQSRRSITAWIKDGPDQPSNIEVHGRTALYDAVLAACKLLGPSKPGDVIYAITDAGDNSSHISETAAARILSKSGIRFFVFLLNEQLPFGLEHLRKDSIADIARATGGFVFGVSGHSSGVQFLPSGNFVYDYDQRTREKIKFYTQAFNIQVHGFYTFRLNSPVLLEKVRKVSLDIVDNKGRARQDVAFTYSRALPPQPD